MKQAPVLITKDVAATKLGRSVRTVERLIARGVLTVRAREQVGSLGRVRALLDHDEVARLASGADPGQYELDLDGHPI